jgi:hypothetical protein
MDTNATTAAFYIASPFSLLTTTEVWNSTSNILTCTPVPGFPANSQILWSVAGQDPAGNQLSGSIAGIFTTGSSGTSGGGGGTYGTNRYTEFAVGKAIYYQQTSTAAPVLSTLVPPYFFYADVTLSSNQAAVSANVQLPSTTVSDLSTTTSPGQFLLVANNNSQTTLDNMYGDGNYFFTVNAANSKEMVTVNLPATLPQPGSPQISNYPIFPRLTLQAEVIDLQ